MGVDRIYRQDDNRVLSEKYLDYNIFICHDNDTLEEIWLNQLRLRFILKSKLIPYPLKHKSPLDHKIC